MAAAAQGRRRRDDPAALRCDSSWPSTRLTTAAAPSRWEPLHAFVCCVDAALREQRLEAQKTALLLNHALAAGLPPLPGAMASPRPPSFWPGPRAAATASVTAACSASSRAARRRRACSSSPRPSSRVSRPASSTSTRSPPQTGKCVPSCSSSSSHLTHAGCGPRRLRRAPRRSRSGRPMPRPRCAVPSRPSPS